jgi:hypothetical protein
VRNDFEFCLRNISIHARKVLLHAIVILLLKHYNNVDFYEFIFVIYLMTLSATRCVASYNWMIVNDEWVRVGKEMVKT